MQVSFRAGSFNSFRSPRSGLEPAPRLNPDRGLTNSETRDKHRLAIAAYARSLFLKRIAPVKPESGISEIPTGVSAANGDQSAEYGPSGQ